MTPSSHLLTKADFCARGYRGLSVHQTTYGRRGTPAAIISERLSPSPPLPPQWAPSYSISCPVNTATGYTQMGVVCSHTPLANNHFGIVAPTVVPAILVSIQMSSSFDGLGDARRQWSYSVSPADLRFCGPCTKTAWSLWSAKDLPVIRRNTGGPGCLTLCKQTLRTDRIYLQRTRGQ